MCCSSGASYERRRSRRRRFSGSSFAAAISRAFEASSPYAARACPGATCSRTPHCSRPRSASRSSTSLEGLLVEDGIVGLRIIEHRPAAGEATPLVDAPGRLVAVTGFQDEGGEGPRPCEVLDQREEFPP